MVKAWADEIILFLINEMKQVPFIWDFKSPQYKNKFKKVQFWDELAKKINTSFAPMVPFSSADVSKKWSNLKAYYHTEQTKGIKAKKSGCSADAVEDVLSNWKYSQPMDFLSTTNEATSSVNNFNKSSLEELYNVEAHPGVEIAHWVETDDDFNDSVNQEEFESQSSNITSTPSSDQKASHVTRKKRKVENENLEAVCESSKKLADVLTKKLLQDEPNAPFGPFVVNELNNLPKHKQLIAKSKITAILFELQSEE